MNANEARLLVDEFERGVNIDWYMKYIDNWISRAANHGKRSAIFSIDLDPFLDASFDQINKIKREYEQRGYDVVRYGEDMTISW